MLCLMSPTAKRLPSGGSARSRLTSVRIRSCKDFLDVTIPVEVAIAVLIDADEALNTLSDGNVFPIRIETQDGLIDQLVSIKMFDLPDDFLKTYRDDVNAVTTEDIQRVAQAYVQPDHAALVIVGDAAEITEQVKPYAEAIEFYDTEGKQKT